MRILFLALIFGLAACESAEQLTTAAKTTSATPTDSGTTPASNSPTQSSPTCANHAVESGLVAKYDFSAGDSYKDTSPHNNTLTPYGTVEFVDGKIGNGAKLDGSTGYFLAAHGSHLNLSTLSIEAWIQPLGNNQGYIISKGDAAYSLFLYTGDLLLDITVNGHGSAFTNKKALANQWTHVVGIYDLSSKSIYLNGLLAGSEAYSSAITNNSNTLSIGRNQEGASSSYFNGMIDQVKIYNRALSASEVQQNYQACD